jgi:transposase
MEAYVGVDWSATEVVCSVAIGDGPVRRIKGSSRTFASVKELLERVRKRDTRIAEVRAIIEAGSEGWAVLFHHAGAHVHVVDGKQAKAFAESVCSSGAKDDARDSDNLVDLGRSPRHLPAVWKPESDQRAQMGELGSMHETLTSQSGAAQQRLRGELRERMPALEAVLDNLTRTWVRKLLREVPTPWHAARMSDAQLEEVMAGSGSRKETRAKVIAALRASAAPWLTESVARVHALHVRLLIDQIELFGVQLEAVEAQLEELTKDLDIHAQLKSVGGIQNKMANRLMEFAFDEVPTHRDQAGIQLGACPVFVGSGKTRKGKPKGKVMMRRAVPSRARATTYLLGRLASQQLRWAGRMYEDARQRGQGAATAYRRIARCVLRILSAIARTGEPYDDARYVATLKAKGVPWAQNLESSAA